MANAAAAAQPGATILQYAQTSDGQQILVPSNQVVVQGERLGIAALISQRGFDLTSGRMHHLYASPAVQTSVSFFKNECSFNCPAASGDVQAYQIRTAPASTIAPGVVMASSPALPTQGATEEVTRKREVRLMKNRYVLELLSRIVSFGHTKLSRTSQLKSG